MRAQGLAFPARAHTPLSLFLSPSVCSVSVQHVHTHLSLSLSASAQFLFSACTHISLSLSLSLCICSIYVQHAHTSLSLSLSVCICSISVQHAHTSLSLSLCLHLLSFCSARVRTSFCLSASDQFLFSARQRRAKLNSVKHRYYVACFSNFTCKYSQNHSIAIVIILYYNFSQDVFQIPILLIYNMFQLSDSYFQVG